MYCILVFKMLLLTLIFKILIVSKKKNSKEAEMSIAWMETKLTSSTAEGHKS